MLNVPYTDFTEHKAEKFDLETARRIVGELADLIRPACDRLEVGGSIRRGSPYVKDAELIAIPNTATSPTNLHAWLDGMVERGVIAKALYGDKQTTRWGQKYRGLLFQGIKVEIFTASETNYGFVKWLRTGPGEANQYIMSYLIWRKAPLRFIDGDGWYSPGNLWHKPKDKWLAEDKVQLAIPDEEVMFTLLGMPYLPPNERSEQQYKKLMGNNRGHRWPDFKPYVLKLPETASMFDVDEPGTGRRWVQRDQPPAEAYGLMSSSAFRQYRAQQRQQFIDDNLERMKAERDGLWKQYQAAKAKIDREPDEHTRKQLREALYAEDGLAWQWAQVDADVSQMEPQ